MNTIGVKPKSSVSRKCCMTLAGAWCSLSWSQRMPVGSKGKSIAEYQDMERREERILKQLEKYKNIAVFIELGEVEV